MVYSKVIILQNYVESWLASICPKHFEGPTLPRFPFLSSPLYKCLHSLPSVTHCGLLKSIYASSISSSVGSVVKPAKPQPSPLLVHLKSISEEDIANHKLKILSSHQNSAVVWDWCPWHSYQETMIFSYLSSCVLAVGSEHQSQLHGRSTDVIRKRNQYNKKR